jgi:hypothetical protein
MQPSGVFDPTFPHLFMPLKSEFVTADVAVH